MSTQTDPSRPMDGVSSSAAGAGAGAGTQDKAEPGAGQAQEKAQQAAGQAQARVREQLDQRSTQLAGQVDQQVSDLRSVSAALRDQGKDRPAEVVDRLAGYAEQAGRYLREKDADAMLGDAEDVGRQKPAAVAAGALALGLAASRFLKASSRKRYSARGPQRAPMPSPEGSGTGYAVPPVPPVPPAAIDRGPVGGATGASARSGF
jgi:hypothetical protein